MKTVLPIPTQFRGVVYRSRSEARFAAYLYHRFCGSSFKKEEADYPEYAGQFLFDSSQCMMMYEPDWLSVNSYVPDFLIIENSTRKWPYGGERHEQYFGLTVIEYKPHRPNEIYMDSLLDSFNELHQRCHGFFGEGEWHIELKVVAGSVYKGEIEELIFEKSYDDDPPHWNRFYQPEKLRDFGYHTPDGPLAWQPWNMNKESLEFANSYRYDLE